MASKSPEVDPKTYGHGQSVGNPDAVEAALADALTAASAAGQWEAVAHLARELEARRRGRLEVVDLDAARAKRKGGGK